MHRLLFNKDEQWLSSHEADYEQNDWQTPVKTLPSLAVGKYQEIWVTAQIFIWEI